MDIATFLGLFFGLAVIIAAIFTGSDIWVFLNIPGFLIVIAGTMAATLIRYPMSGVLGAFMLGIRAAFTGSKDTKPQDLIDLSIDMAKSARKSGFLSLSKVSLPDPFLAHGVRMLVDGYSYDVIHTTLVKDMNNSIERHEEGERIFRAIGESAPAFGMIGTLVGLVQMLAGLDDPKTIGPAMAVALLTTLYGAVIANLIALPIADKLENKIESEHTNKSLIIDAVLGIHKGQNTSELGEILETYLPDNIRAQELEEDEDD
jgi:chemotaxis protein MotA